MSDNDNQVFNPYAPPKADLGMVDVNNEGSSSFYVVSKRKFLILFIITFGGYMVYWNYKNWSLYKKSVNDTSIWPVPRGIFIVFFTHQLFAKVQDKITASQRSYAWNPRSLAHLVVLFLLLDRVLEKMAAKEFLSPWSDLAGIGMVFVLAFLYAQAQDAINFASNDPLGESNAEMSFANYAWCALGGLFWLLVVYGMFDMFATYGLVSFLS